MNTPNQINLDQHPKQMFDFAQFGGFIDNSMKELIRGSRITIQGHTVNAPESLQTYPGCWVRDFTMLCESGHTQITPEFIREGLDLFLQNMGPNGEVPDWVPSNPKKKVVYDLFGKFPFLDNPFWLIRLMVLYIDASQDLDFFLHNEKKMLAGLHSQKLIEKGDELLQISEKNLRDDWGFTDCVKKTGYVLFSNLLKLDTYRTFSHLYHLIGNEPLSREYKERFGVLQHLIVEELFDPQQGLLYSATGVNHKIDVWGNAFGVFLGILPKEIEAKIISLLYQNREKFVWKGQIRHLLKPDTWDDFLYVTKYLKLMPNTYQNGAYWGVPSGWMAYTFEKAHPGSGKKLIEELLYYYKKNGIYECVYPKFLRHYRKCNHYVASLALPMRIMNFQ